MRLEVPGLSAPGEIVRKHLAVPHIFGRDRCRCLLRNWASPCATGQALWHDAGDARTAQGTSVGRCSARPRWQIRTTCCGRLDVYNLATESRGRARPAHRVALEAYEDGVNALARLIGNAPPLRDVAPAGKLFLSDCPEI